ncbi:hypothetical protein SBA3_290018 [Candidatus Sulfopaludibacter sp. SbA3]|nr:hypothetical protein SBA3_290018 [Candidatus Sulfopaludibacter sp. SbA3]
MIAAWRENKSLERILGRQINTNPPAGYPQVCRFDFDADLAVRPRLSRVVIDEYRDQVA